MHQMMKRGMRGAKVDARQGQGNKEYMHRIRISDGGINDGY